MAGPGRVIDLDQPGLGARRLHRGLSSHRPRPLQLRLLLSGLHRASAFAPSGGRGRRGRILGSSGLLDQAVTAVAALPAPTTAGLASEIAAIAAMPSDDAATATVSACPAAAADNVVTAQAPSAAPPDPVLGLPVTLAAPADLTGCLASLAGWGRTVAPITSGGIAAMAQITQQAALIALIQDAAVAAIAQVYAQTYFPYAPAAEEARTSLLAMLDAQAEAAGDVGADDLYRGWQVATTLLCRT